MAIIINRLYIRVIMAQKRVQSFLTEHIIIIIDRLYIRANEGKERCNQNSVNTEHIAFHTEHI